MHPKSAFTRRAPSKATLPPSGTKRSVYNENLLVSSGIASLDEVLGGGIPVGSALLVQQDDFSSHADLIQRVFVAQGLACPTHHVAILSSRLEEDGGPAAFIENLPLRDNASDAKQKSADSDEESPASDAPMKIAFRYEALKLVDPQASVTEAEASFCSTFDLTRRLPAELIDWPRAHLIDVTPDATTQKPIHEYSAELEQVVETAHFSHSSSPSIQRGILRIAIQSFASTAWGYKGSELVQELFRFLLRLRKLLRGSLACAMITMRPALLDAAMVRRFEHLCDSVISLQSFAARPDLAEMFTRYAGLLHIRTLPTMNTLVPPSTRLAVLRGSSGKDDLGYRLKRRRLVVEALRLDVDGGVNERRVPKVHRSEKSETGAAEAGIANTKLFDY